MIINNSVLWNNECSIGVVRAVLICFKILRLTIPENESANLVYLCKIIFGELIIQTSSYNLYLKSLGTILINIKVDGGLDLDSCIDISGEHTQGERYSFVL